MYQSVSLCSATENQGDDGRLPAWSRCGRRVSRPTSAARSPHHAGTPILAGETVVIAFTKSVAVKRPVLVASAIATIVPAICGAILDMPASVVRTSAGVRPHGLGCNRPHSHLRRVGCGSGRNRVRTRPLTRKPALTISTLFPSIIGVQGAGTGRSSRAPTRRIGPARRKGVPSRRVIPVGRPSLAAPNGAEKR